MRLKELRQARGWTQATFAAKVGLSREYIACLETGHHDPPLSPIEHAGEARQGPQGEGGETAGVGGHDGLSLPA